jgi:formylglycine-generating enzyme required for sulfatase activity
LPVAPISINLYVRHCLDLKIIFFTPTAFKKNRSANNAVFLGVIWMRSRTFRTITIVILVLTSLVFSSGLARAEELIRTYTNSIGMKFVLISSGSFMMGADKNIEEAGDDEQPRHQVTISNFFYLGVYEVTQRQWQAVMGNNPSKFKGNDSPVEEVSWGDIQVFIRRLNKKEGHSRYRLPTEAEWEYAARAGSTSAYFFGDDESQLGDHAWYGANSGETTHPVGQKRPNAWGLYDMIGNVWEWVGDWYGEAYYANSPSADPTGPLSGTKRINRGCGWAHDASSCRSAIRFDDWPDARREHDGFRLVLPFEGSK